MSEVSRFRAGCLGPALVSGTGALSAFSFLTLSCDDCCEVADVVFGALVSSGFFAVLTSFGGGAEGTGGGLLPVLLCVKVPRSARVVGLIEITYLDVLVLDHPVTLIVLQRILAGICLPHVS